jgi:thioredoxin 1
MPATAINADTFEETVEKNGIVLLDFWAAWCGPCRQFAPVFEEASEKHPDITWGKIDTEAEPELAGALRISAIPTLMVFREGILVFRQSGALRGPDLERLVELVRGLDMDDVKRQVAEAAAKESEGPANAE